MALVQTSKLALNHPYHCLYTVLVTVFNFKYQNMKRLDKNEREVKNGDVIDLHQTVNGQNLFVVFKVEPLDVRYAHDITRKYEYDKEELFKPCKYSGEVEYEIVANLYCQMLGLAF